MAEKHRQSKRKLEEENSVKEGDGVVDSHSYVEDMQEEEDGYSSDDCVTFADGRKMSRELQDKYLRQIDESDGFDITLDLELGETLLGPVVPLRIDYHKPTCTTLSRMAIDKFNKDNAQNYEFVKLVNITGQMAGGIWYRITFDAKDADAAEDCNDAVKNFQAYVWWGSDTNINVKFCRLKKSSNHEGDKKSPDPASPKKKSPDPDVGDKKSPDPASPKKKSPDPDVGMQ